MPLVSPLPKRRPRSMSIPRMIFSVCMHCWWPIPPALRKRMQPSSASASPFAGSRRHCSTPSRTATEIVFAVTDVPALLPEEHHDGLDGSRGNIRTTPRPDNSETGGNTRSPHRRNLAVGDRSRRRIAHRLRRRVVDDHGLCPSALGTRHLTAPRIDSRSARALYQNPRLLQTDQRLRRIQRTQAFRCLDGYPRDDGSIGRSRRNLCRRGGSRPPPQRRYLARYSALESVVRRGCPDRRLAGFDHLPLAGSLGELPRSSADLRQTRDHAWPPDRVRIAGCGIACRPPRALGPARSGRPPGSHRRISPPIRVSASPPSRTG